MVMSETKARLTEVLDEYLGAWNEVDPAVRAQLLERTVSDDVLFVDPMGRAEGRDALAAHIAAVRTQFPEVSYGPSGEVDEHNGFLRQAWVARGKDGMIVLRGLDVDDVGPDGRLTRIIGFFDRA